MIEKRLVSNGYEVILAKDGAEAVKKAQAHHPDLIIMDIMMPELDGTEAVRMIRDDERTRDIPVIYVTALKNQNDDPVDNTFETSATLSKPFNAHELLEKIDAMINRKR